MRLLRGLSLLLGVVVPCLCASRLPGQRLPTNVVPEHYKLHLSPDIAAKTFTGVESIEVRLGQPAASIVLNSAEIEIESVKAVAAGAEQMGTVSYQPEREQATLTFPAALPAGKVELRLQYKGKLNDDLRGFYLSHTAKRDYAVTQFEATDARRAFPCFDEPALKATFDLSLTVDGRDTVIANMPMTSDTPAAGGRHTESFSTTPRMSTYLLAFQVGDWACIKGGADGIPIRVCATPDKVGLTQYSLAAAEHLLHYYDTYFGIKYALPKLDLIGIPDFAAGAMENWGCITYRETALLVQPQDTLAAHERVVSVVAHEMAHQWFGDLVTAEWWNNIWLNEGFATWMADKATGEYQPTWHVPEETALGLNRTMNRDAEHNTRTIQSKAETPTEISEQFDGLSYGKAGDVLGMVEHFTSPEVFRRGVHNYLEAHKFANATAEDFWNAETAVSHQPVDAIMRSLITQPGVPLLHFGDGRAGATAVTQSRFFLNPEGAPSSAETWTLPVCARGGGCNVISSSPATLPDRSSRTPLLQADGIGYFRSTYTPAWEAALTRAVGDFAPTERIVFLGDREAEMQAGSVPAGELLSLVGQLRGEPNNNVLQEVFESTDAVKRIANDAELRQLRQWLVRSFSPAYAAMAAPAATDDANTVWRRLVLFVELGEDGDPAVVAAARPLAEAYLRNDPSAAEMGPAALRIAATHGDEAFYDEVLAASKADAAPNVHTAELTALGRFSQPALVRRTVEYAVSGAVRKQEFFFPLTVMLGERDTQAAAWDAIRADWPQLSAIAGGGITGNSSLRIIYATASFCSAEKESEVREFFAAHPGEGDARPLREALSRIHACTELRERQGASLAEWTAAH